MIKQSVYSLRNARGGPLKSSKIHTCQNFWNVQNLWQSFSTSISTAIITSNKKLFFDKNSHLEFAPDDPEDPKNYSFKRKCYITAVSISLGISDDLHVSVEAAGLVTTLFLLGYCAGPPFWAPLFEFYGRRWIFFISFTLYLAFGFLCAFTPNFAGLIIGRFLAGTAVSAALTNGPGVLADIWQPVGPSLGPVVSGFLQLQETWRWTFYVLLWMAGATEILLITLPETLPIIVLRNKVRRLRRIPGKEHVKAPVETSNCFLAGIYKIALTRPWKLLIDPVNFFVAIYYAVV
ncbi:MFS general substrate transporter [Penicillium angulare]|uniref:MFS general substrate transporter n=1 Tax=Penicillium angulare TaxID=116970 RepID=UPI002540E824|nr:MFS general substrate transporter [Penicillium angulare]KAJ5288180.1 MFS general substrate transporter [Penicillium angulare]